MNKKLTSIVITLILLPVIFDFFSQPSIVTSILYLFFWLYIGYFTRMGFKKGLITGAVSSMAGILALLATGILLLLHSNNSVVSYMVQTWLTPTSSLYQNFTPLLVLSPAITTLLSGLGNMIGKKLYKPTNISKITLEKVVNIYVGLILLFFILPNFPVLFIVTTLYILFWLGIGLRLKSGWKKGLTLGAWGSLPGFISLGLMIPVTYPRVLLYIFFANSIIWCPPLTTFQFNKILVITSPFLTILLVAFGSWLGKRFKLKLKF